MAWLRALIDANMAKFYLLLEESKRYYDDAFCKRRKAGALGV